MKEYIDNLKKLKKEIPVYGYGTVSELNNVYLEARKIILHVVADEKHKSIQQEFGVSSVDIDSCISYARIEKTKKGQKEFFERAAKQLEDDVDSIIRLLEYEEKNSN